MNPVLLAYERAEAISGALLAMVALGALQVIGGLVVAPGSEIPPPKKKTRNNINEDKKI